MIPKLIADLPPGISIDVANDNSVFIDQSIKSVFQTIVEAIVLVALVIFVFLRTLRASIIPIVTIPVCLVGTFALMALAGFTINTLTLLALVLAIGLVVDDAIVVLENIYRHIEEGMDPFSASIKGVREVGFAVVAMTLTLVAVYAPLAFTPGRTGRLFIEFALALAGAVVVSGFIALTLSPMMCSLLLRHNPNPSWFDSHMERWLDALTAGYQRVLTWLVTTRYDPGKSRLGASHSLRRRVLDARWIVIGVMLLSGVGIAIVLPGMKRELSPLEDRGQVLAVVTAPDGATLDYTNRYVGAIERMGQPYKEFDRIFVSSGNPTVSQANVFFRAVDWDLRSRSILDVARELQPKLASLPGVTAFPITPPSLGPGLSGASGQFCADHHRQLPEPVDGDAAVHGRDRQKPGHRERRHRPAAEQAGTQDRCEPGEGGRSGRQRRRGGARHRDHAGRPPGHALQARGRPVRRDRADPGDGT